MLEEMSAFFENRLDVYDEHMRRDIEGAAEFYGFTATRLPMDSGCRILDLGCGTGLELEDYYALNPEADVTGIDLSGAMLDALSAKLLGKKLSLVRGSYFDVPLGESAYDAAVSVESLHHFSAERKLELYKRLFAALRPGGYFILTDYFAKTEEYERSRFEELERLKVEQNLEPGIFYHYDTPLTLEHELAVLAGAGFINISVLAGWGPTYCIKAEKPV